MSAAQTQNNPPAAGRFFSSAATRGRLSHCLLAFYAPACSGSPSKQMKEKLRLLCAGHTGMTFSSLFSMVLSTPSCLA